MKPFFLRAAVIFLLALPSSGPRAVAQDVPALPVSRASYTVTFEADQPRVARVRCTIVPAEANKEPVVLRMDNNGASDLEDGYARYLRGLRAEDADRNPLDIEKLGQARWVLRPRGKSVHLSYEAVLRHDERDWKFGPDEAPYARDDCVFWTGRALFVVLDVKDIELRFELPRGWNVSTQWVPIMGEVHSFQVDDEDDLTESFLLLGTHHEHVARSGHTEVVLAIGGEFKKSKELIQETVEGFLGSYAQLFGGTPTKRMLLVMNPIGSRDTLHGGVFGRSISLLMGNRPDEGTRQRWAPFVGHEILHLWNAGAIRSSGQEYWFSEGFTNYYSQVVSARLGWTAERDFFRSMERACRNYLSKQGELSIREAGDSKFSQRELVYDGGSLIGALLDFQIRKLTGNRKSLDEVMKEMYRLFGVADKPYTEKDLLHVVNKVSGNDFGRFFADHVAGKKRIPLERYFANAGLRVETELDEELPARMYVIYEMLHISSLTQTNEGLIIRRSQEAGFRDEDKLIAVNGVPVKTFLDLQKMALSWKLGQDLELTVLRNTRKINVPITIGGRPTHHPPTERNVRISIIHKKNPTDLERDILSGVLKPSPRTKEER